MTHPSSPICSACESLFESCASLLFDRLFMRACFIYSYGCACAHPSRDTFGCLTSLDASKCVRYHLYSCPFCVGSMLKATPSSYIGVSYSLRPVIRGFICSLPRKYFLNACYLTLLMTTYISDYGYPPRQPVQVTSGRGLNSFRDMIQLAYNCKCRSINVNLMLNMGSLNFQDSWFPR